MDDEEIIDMTRNELRYLSLRFYRRVNPAQIPNLPTYQYKISKKMFDGWTRMVIAEQHTTLSTYQPTTH